MLLLLTLALTANPRPLISGLDRLPRTLNLRRSTLHHEQVTARCFDLGTVALVEVRDPGMLGATGAWLKKKDGKAMPRCDEDYAGTFSLPGVEGFGLVEGTKGNFIFTRGPEGFGEVTALRIYLAPEGKQLLDSELDTSRPATLRAEGKHLWLRYHEGIPAGCVPHGPEAGECWKKILAEAGLPQGVQLTLPDCAPGGKVPEEITVAVPVERDLHQPEQRRFLSGAATCHAPL